MHFDDIPPPSHPTTGPFRGGGTSRVPVVRLRRRLDGLALRHDGPAALQPGPQPAVRSLLGRRARRSRPRRGKVDEYGGYATSIFMVGWALGGIFFGILGDKMGRARPC